MTETTPQPAAFTDDERSTLRAAPMHAAAWVSRADRGFFDTFKESFAASKAMKDAPAEVQQLVIGGGLPEMPKGSPTDAEARSLELLREAIAILRAKAPQLVEDYRSMVVQSCRDVAAAAGDTSASEQDVLGRVEQALA